MRLLIHGRGVEGKTQMRGFEQAVVNVVKNEVVTRGWPRKIGFRMGGIPRNRKKLR
jgi:hypothetical protein